MTGKIRLSWAIGALWLVSCGGSRVNASRPASWPVSLPVLGIVRKPRSLDQRIQFQFSENGKLRNLTFRGRVELDSKKLLMWLLTPEGIPVLQVGLRDGNITSHNYSSTRLPFPPRHLIEAFTLIYWPTNQLVELLSRGRWRLRQFGASSRLFYESSQLVVSIDYRGSSRWTGEACMDDHRYQLKLCLKILD